LDKRAEETRSFRRKAIRPDRQTPYPAALRRKSKEILNLRCADFAHSSRALFLSANGLGLNTYFRLICKRMAVEAFTKRYDSRKRRNLDSVRLFE